MGTYTTNYNLFMPSVGEQGWGELVNGNFTTIDTTMKSLSNSIGTLETETDAVEERVTASEGRITDIESVVNNGNVTADTFSFKSIVMPTLSYDGYITGVSNSKNDVFTLFSSPFPISGKISVKSSVTSIPMWIVTTSGITKQAMPTTQTEISVTNLLSITLGSEYSGGYPTYTIGKFVFI